jgi:glycolate oxidase FAD binding subunit
LKQGKPLKYMIDRKTRRWLTEIVGEAGVKEGETLKDYGVDGQVPQAVLFPGSREEIEKIVVLALEQGLTIVPWGGGTDMGLGTPPRRLDLVVCLTRLDRILDQDHENMTVTAEAGVCLAAIQENLLHVGPGFFLPLDPPRADKATLGGTIADNSSGPRRLRYGTLRDLVLGIEVIIPGQAAQGLKTVAGGKTVKNVSGYDMSKLYIGSLGTLALIIEATCRILPVPEDQATVVLGFPSSKQPWALTRTLLESQLLPSCIEVYNPMTASVLSPSGNSPAETTVEAWAAVGFEGIREAVERQIAEIETLARSHGAEHIAILRGSGEAAFWQRLGRLALEVHAKGDRSIGIKVSVPLTLTHEMSAAIDKHTAHENVVCFQLSHAGSGIVYAHLSLDEDLYMRKEEPLIEMLHDVRNQAEAMDGSVVVMHAPPEFKGQVDVWGDVGGMLPLMQRLKRAFDPRAILNPGRYIGGM